MAPDGKRKPLLGKQCIGKEWGNFPSFIEQNILSHTKKSILNAIPREQYPCIYVGTHMYLHYKVKFMFSKKAMKIDKKFYCQFDAMQ